MTMQARETFFHAGGTEVGGTQRPDDHPLVAQFPMFYELLDQFEVRVGSDANEQIGRVVVEQIRRGRPPGSKNKPKPTEETP